MCNILPNPLICLWELQWFLVQEQEITVGKMCLTFKHHFPTILAICIDYFFYLLFSCSIFPWLY